MTANTSPCDATPTDDEIEQARERLASYRPQARIHYLAGCLAGAIDVLATYITDPHAARTIARARAHYAAFEELA